MVSPGQRFSATYADGLVTWTVQHKVGNGYWECSMQSPDWGSVTQAFHEAVIKSIIVQERQQVNSNCAIMRWVETLDIGAIVHYHDGFNNYVRCEVVKAPFDPDCDTWGGKALKKLALVGNWRQPLVKRLDDGTIYEDYHVRTLGEVFRPHGSNVWEYPYAPCHKNPDPRQLEPLSTEVPAATNEQVLQLIMRVAADEVQEALSARTLSTELLTEMSKRLLRAVEEVNAGV